MDPEEEGMPPEPVVVPVDDAALVSTTVGYPEPAAAPVEVLAPDELLAPSVLSTPQRKPFWGYIDLLLFMGLATAITVVLLIPLVLVAKLGASSSSQEVALNLGAQAVLYAAIYFALKIVFAVRYHRPVFPSLGWTRSVSRPGLYALGGVLLALGVQGLLALLHTPEVKSPVEGLISSRISLLIVGIMAVVAAPIFEEVVFRGFLQPLLSRTFGTIAGILITAALFGSLHYTEYSGVWQYAAAITVLGAFFGWVRMRTDSLIPSTIMHACHNSVAVLALILSRYSHLK